MIRIRLETEFKCYIRCLLFPGFSFLLNKKYPALVEKCNPSIQISLSRIQKAS